MKRTWTIGSLVLLLIIGGTASLTAGAAPASEISVDEQREIEIPDTRIISLSPDGTMLVGRIESGESSERQLCTYDIETLAVVACASLAGLDSGLRIEDVTWSPDSTKIAFAEDAFRIFRDGDIWVMDAQTGELTDLTDEGIRGPLPILSSEDSDITEFFMDVNPAWSSDSQAIAFSRTTWRDGEWRGNSIEIIPASGGEPELVTQVSQQEPGIVYWGIEWQADGSRIFYNLNHTDNSDPENGIWVIDRDGSNNRKIAGAANPELGPPIVVQVSPDGTYLLGYYIIYAAQYGFKGPQFTLIDVDSGKTTDLTPPDPNAPEIALVSVAALSPDGSKLLTVTRLSDPDNQVYVQDISGGEPVKLTEGLSGAAMIAFGVVPTWATDGSIYISANVGIGTLLHLKGGEERPDIATPIAVPSEIATTPITTGTVTEIASGATVYVNDDGVRLRAAPSRDAQSVLEVERGTLLTVLGPSQEGDGLTWWPVIEPESNTIGWVRAELISLEGENE